MEFNHWLQSRLTAHGYPCGPIDGIIGAATTRALKAFERSAGLAVDGLADQAVIDALRAQSSGISTEERAILPDRDHMPAPDMGRTRFPHQNDVPGFYGKPGSDLVKVEVPWDLYLAWDPSVRVSGMSLHKKTASSARRAFNRIRGIYSDREIRSLGLDMFGGSFNIRRMRGGSRLSMHSWGIAIDFDPERNRLSWHRPQARLSHDDALMFWKAWEDEGWTSLGRSKNFDWMHVQAAHV